MRKIYLLLFLICSGSMVWSQSIFNNTITGTNPNTFNPYTDGQVADPNLNVSGIGRGSGINGSNANNRYNASGWSVTQLDENDYFEFTISPITGFSIHFTSFEFSGQASASGPTQFSLRSSIDGYVSEIAALSATGSVTSLTASTFQGIENSISFRIYGWGAASTSGTFSINDFSFNGTVEPGGVQPTPQVQVSSSLNNFSSIQGLPSISQSYSVSGSNLNGPVTINAPAGFEVSSSSAIDFGSSLVLPSVNGSLDATTIYIRMNSAAPGAKLGQVEHSAGSTVLQQLQVSGIVLATEPDIPATISFSNITANTFDIQFNGGNGSGRIVIMKQGSAVTASPEDGFPYTQAAAFGSGQEPEPGEFVVYAGSANTLHVTSLQANTFYHVSVYEYNDAGISEAINYAVNGAMASQITEASVSGFQLSVLHSPMIIDFDHSSFEANNGPFDGSGFDPGPSSGQLNSGAWSITGWSDGNLEFNGSRTTGDYARGFTLTHPSTGGVYAFEPLLNGNRALGIQPGSNDWAPGTITLRIVNLTGFTVNNLGIAYKLFVYNNADRSSSFNFSYSTDNVNYIPVTILDFASPEPADATPQWMLEDKHAEITGLSIDAGQFVYLRWNSTDISGTGSRDEFALDDILITGNPIATGPLPVQFTMLKAYQRPNGIQLEFGNSTEENLEKYIIERSGNGNHFITLATIEPTENSGGNAFYRVLDHAPFEGNNYYRVKSIETTGNISYSSIIRINKDAQKQGIQIYPNPSEGTTLAIQVDQLPAGNYAIKIYDATGRLVMQHAVKHEGGATTQYLTVSHLHAGWYSLQICGDTILKSQFIKR